LLLCVEANRQWHVAIYLLMRIVRNKDCANARYSGTALRKSIEKIDADLATEKDPLRKLDLVQSKIKKQKDLEEFESPIDMVALENEFVGVAKDYNDSKELSPEAWLELGVPRDVLRRAGILS
jgi:hypothetical protein